MSLGITRTINLPGKKEKKKKKLNQHLLYVSLEQKASVPDVNYMILFVLEAIQDEIVWGVYLRSRLTSTK